MVRMYRVWWERLHGGWFARGTRVALVLALLLVISSPVGGVRAQADRQQVLVLNSYHHGLSWTDNLVEGIKSVLDPETQDLELYLEYMDTKRVAADTTYYEDLAVLFADKYRDIDLDVLIVADNNAFSFMLAYHDSLFPGVPVVFCGVNFFEDAMLEGHREFFTGVVENVDIEATLDLMLAVHPNVQEILVINDATTTGQIYAELFRDLLPKYAQVTFTFFENPDMPQLLEALPGLSPDTLVLLVLLNRDAAGNFYTYEQSIDLISPRTPVPIYGLWDFYMGRGMIGGKLTNGFSQGAAAAQKAQQILDGSPAGEVPILRESPNRYMFDYRELQRFGIDSGVLPEESAFLYRPQTFFEQNRAVIWPAAAIIAVLAGAAVIQTVNAARTRRAEEALRAGNVELEAIRTTLEERVFERTRALQERTLQLRAASEVAQEAVAIQDTRTLLDTTVNLISDRFDFYHAGIFLLDEAREYAVLEAASSEGGKRLLDRGHRLRVGSGIVGSVVATAQPRIALDVGADAHWLDNPDLPETRSELGLPLRARGRIIGVLDVQSREPSAFSEEDIEVLQTMAEQVGLAIDNARLFETSQEALRQAERAYGQQARLEWEARLRRKPAAFRYTGSGVTPLAPHAQRTAADAGDRNPRRTVTEIGLRDQVFATLELERDPDAAPWTDQEMALIEALSLQAALALENARLFEDTVRRGQREQLVREITDDIRAAVSVDDAIRRALAQMQRALGASELVARLGTADSLAASDEERTHGN